MIFPANEISIYWDFPATFSEFLGERGDMNHENIH